MAMATTSLHISLSEQLKQEVHDEVERGHFSNATDYVRHLIRQDIQRKRAYAEFQAFIAKGINSPSCGQTPSEMITELKRDIQHNV